jgi:hypothetical protein
MAIGGTPSSIWVDPTSGTPYWRNDTGTWYSGIVQPSSPSAGQVLAWNATSSTWVAAGGGVHADLVWNGSAYPTRPSTAICPAGYANYIGPSANTPSDWVSGDTWDAY